jgi:hypothetical protein
MPVFLALVAALLLFNMCSPREINPQGGAYGSGNRDREHPRCNRASCWDGKSGHYVGANEWDKRQRDRQ